MEPCDEDVNIDSFHPLTLQFIPVASSEATSIPDKTPEAMQGRDKNTKMTKNDPQLQTSAPRCNQPALPRHAQVQRAVARKTAPAMPAAVGAKHLLP